MNIIRDPHAEKRIDAAENFQLETTEPEQKKQRPFIEPGWYRDLGNEEYHGSFGTSSTRLKKFIENAPLEVDYQSRHPQESTKNMALGTAVHTLVLEPEKFADEIAVMPDYSGRGSTAQKQEFREANEGKTIITESQFIDARAMAESVQNHDHAMTLLDSSIRESSIYWWYRAMDPDDDTEYRELVKVRPDALGVGQSVAMDLKSCDDATYSGFQRSMQKFYYHVSAAMYLEGINQCEEALDAMGIFACNKFLFICVENTAPYLTAVYELSPEYLDIGKVIYRRCVYRLHRAKTDDWPGIPGIRVLEPPTWAKNLWIV